MGPGQSDAQLEVLVRELAQRTGLRLTEDELRRVAAVMREYLGYVNQLDAAEVDPAVDAVVHPCVPLHQLLAERDVRLLRVFHLRPPAGFNCVVADDRRRDDEIRDRFIYVTLAELRVRESGPMTHQLVRQ